MHPLWEPGWEERLSAAILAKGYGSVLELLKVNPAITYADLTGVIGIPFAEVQLQYLANEEAVREGCLFWVARDIFARKVVEHFPEGWRIGDAYESPRLSCLGDWGSTVLWATDEPSVRQAVMGITRSISHDPPPPGWMPAGPDDPLIVKRMAEFWPSTVS